MSTWSLIVDIIVISGSLAAVLDYFGIKPKPSMGAASMPSRKWKLVIMLGLVALSLGLTGYAFYRSLRPKIVEKIIEKPVDRIVEKEKIVPAECPKPPTAEKAKKAKKDNAPPAGTPQQPPMTQDCGGGNCAQSSGQTGGVTAGAVIVDTPPLHITWAVKDGVSNIPDLPYEQNVTVMVNTMFHPVSLAIVCDSEIDRVMPIGAFMAMISGIYEKHTGYFRYSSPPLSPGESLVISVFAKHPFVVKDVVKANFQF